MKKIKYKLNKQGIGTTACPHGFTTFVGNRIKRVGSDCMFCKYRKHIDFDNKIVECMYGGSGKKIRFDCKKMAKCGMTSFSRCRANTAGLKECDTCTLVNKANKRWKMIDRKPHKKCKNCGKFLPVEKFYPRSIKKPNGVVYKTIEPVCKMCRSTMRLNKIKEEMKRQPNTL